MFLILKEGKKECGRGLFESLSIETLVKIRMRMTYLKCQAAKSLASSQWSSKEHQSTPFLSSPKTK